MKQDYKTYILWGWCIETFFICEGEEIGRIDRVQIGQINDSHNFIYLMFYVMYAAIVKYPAALYLWKFCCEFERIHDFTLNLCIFKKDFCTY